MTFLVKYITFRINGISHQKTGKLDYTFNAAAAAAGVTVTIILPFQKIIRQENFPTNFRFPFIPKQLRQQVKYRFDKTL